MTTFSSSACLTTQTEVISSVINSTQIINATSVSYSISTITHQVVTTNTINVISVLTNTQLINSTSTTTITSIVTISATPRGSTVAMTVSANSSPYQTLEQPPLGTFSDGTSLAWMSMFILFLLLTIAAVTVSVYLACLLKTKRKHEVNSKGDVALVQASSLRKSRC